MIGTSLAHYEILDQLGKGGMGEVLQARDTKLARRIALKVLPEELASDRERLDRFQREARVVAALSHPNIVTIHSVEEADGHHFLTMELVTGSTLEDVIRDGGVDIGTFMSKRRKAELGSEGSSWPKKVPPDFGRGVWDLSERFS